jgi:hypothetical protein
MMAGSPASIFDDDEPDAPPPVPRPDPEQVRALSEAANFRSREAVPVPPPPAPKRQPWRYRTGRNVQFNARAKQQTVDDFHAIAEQLDRPIGEVLERALAALKRELAKRDDMGSGQ